MRVALAALLCLACAGCPLRTVCNRGYRTTHDDAGALACTPEDGAAD